MKKVINTAIFCFLFLLGISLAFYFYQDAYPTTLLYFHDGAYTSAPRGPVTEGLAVKGEVTAQSDNLGAVKIKLRTFNRLNDNTIVFRLREKGEDKWSVINMYKTDRIPGGFLYPFGFPVISDSKGKTYEFELSSQNGTMDNAVGLEAGYHDVASNYVFSKKEILETKDTFISFVKEKTRSLLSAPEFDLYLFMFLIPSFYYLLTVLRVNKNLMGRIGELCCFYLLFSYVYLPISVNSDIVLYIFAVEFLIALRQRYISSYAFAIGILFLMQIPLNLWLGWETAAVLSGRIIFFSLLTGLVLLIKENFFLFPLEPVQSEKKGMKKIVFVLPIYSPAQLTGSEVVVKDLAEMTVREGYDVTVITSNAYTARYWYDPLFAKSIKPSFETLGGVSVVRLPCNHIFSSFFFIMCNVFKNVPILQRMVGRFADYIELFSWGPTLIGLDRTLRRIRPDFVVVSPFPAGICLSVRNSCRSHSIPYAVVPFFKKDQDLFANTLLTKILDDASIIYTPTKTERTYIQQYTKNSNVALLPSGIDRDFIQTHTAEIQERANELRKSKRFAGKKIILFVGNKGLGKGITDLVEAVIGLTRSDVVLVTIGNATMPWNHYRKEISSPSFLVDLPYTSGIEKYAYFSLADALVLPSVTDNFPLVFLEAWQFKKPVVAYDFYSMKELLEDGSGFLAKPNDIDDLGNVITNILDNPTRGKRAGRIGYQKLKNYSRDMIVKKYFLPPIGDFFRYGT